MKSPQGAFENVSESRRRIMQKIHGKDTDIEMKLRKALWHRGIRYRKNYKALIGTPDIAITKYKIAIFCDGEFFHGKEWPTLEERLKKGKNPEYWITKINKNMQRDLRNNLELRGLGWTVIHFWEEDIQNHLEECVKAVEEAVLASRIDSCEKP